MEELDYETNEWAFFIAGGGGGVSCRRNVVLEEFPHMANLGANVEGDLRYNWIIDNIYITYCIYNMFPSHSQKGMCPLLKKMGGPQNGEDGMVKPLL